MAISGSVVVGSIIINGVEYAVRSAAIAITASGDVTVVAASGTFRVRVLSLWLTASANQRLSFKSDGTALIANIYVAPRDTFSPDIQTQGYLLDTSAGEAFKISQDDLPEATIGGSALYVYF